MYGRNNMLNIHKYYRKTKCSTTTFRLMLQRNAHYIYITWTHFKNNQGMNICTLKYYQYFDDNRIKKCICFKCQVYTHLE